MLLVDHFGTFDVENYGDLLFPIIFQKELFLRFKEATYQIRSPSASNEIHLACHPNQLGSIVIGGGDIISFKGNIAPLFSWQEKVSPHTACWALPAIKRPSGVSLVWNAPGIPYPFSSAESVIVRAFTEQADYLSVRDEISLSFLQDAGVKKEVAIVPDTCCKLSEHFPKNTLLARAEAVLRPLQLDLMEPLVFQSHPGIKKKERLTLVENLSKLSKRLGRKVLLLPIGYCHNDYEFLEEIHKSSNGLFLFVKERLDPLSIAAIIAHAGCFVGTSLHGSITAYSYQVPFLIYNSAGLVKLKGFSRLAQEQERHTTTMDEIIEKSYLLKIPASSTIRKQMIDQVDRHFEKIFEIMLQKSPFIQKGPQLLEEYINVLAELRWIQEEYACIKNSRSWKVANFLKKSYSLLNRSRSLNCI